MANSDQQTKPVCENCGKPLFGRSDKRFCNDGCRNNFNRNNALLERKNHENLPEIFKTIKRNYEILIAKGHLEKDVRIFTETGSIKDLGINANFFTSIYEDGGTIWNFVLNAAGVSSRMEAGKSWTAPNRQKLVNHNRICEFFELQYNSIYHGV
jgi:hypothetical protein